MTQETRSDEQLLEAWRLGDGAAGEAVCKRLFEPLYRFFRNKVDRGAEDLVQQTLAALIEGQARFEGKSTLRGYVFGIARNMLRAAIRQRYTDGREPDFDSQSIEDLVPSPSSVVGQRQTESRLHRAMRRLQVDQQIVLELYYWEGLSGPEISDALGLSEGGVRSRLHRAKAALRALLEDTGASPTEVETSMSGLASRPPPDQRD